MRKVILKNAEKMISTNRSKRAETYAVGVLMTAIVIIIFALIFMFSEKQMKDDATDILKKRICKESVWQNGQNRIIMQGSDLTDRFGNKRELKCSTDYIEVTTDDNKKIKKQIADAMYHCYDQYHQGTLPIFDVEDNNICVICSVLDIKEKTTLHDFATFLKEENTPNPTEEEKYFDFFYKTHGEDYNINKFPDERIAELDTISTEPELATVFFMAKEGFMGKPASAYTGATAGAAVGVAVGVILTATGVFAEVGIPIIYGSATVALGGAGAGSALGFLVGSPVSTIYDASIMITPLENVDNIDCTFLAGKATEGLSVFDDPNEILKSLQED